TVRSAAEQIGVEAGIHGTPWVLSLEAPSALIVAEPRATLRRLLVYSLLITLAGVLVSWAVSRRITRPLVDLTLAAGAVAESDFLAVMSHELRTPLNAIGGYAEILEMGIYGPVTEKQRDAIARIARSQQTLLSLINDVLNFAKLEAGEVQYAMQDVAVTGVIE